jgi:hypothetical protein
MGPIELRAIGWIVQEEQEQHFIATLANERPMCSVLISKSNEFKSFACIEKFESGSSHVAHPPVALPPAGLAGALSARSITLCQITPRRHAAGENTHVLP